MIYTNRKRRGFIHTTVVMTLLLALFAQCAGAMKYVVNAEDNGFDLAGNVYVFDDKKNEYPITNSEIVSDENNPGYLGHLSVHGAIADAYSKDGHDAYQIVEGNVSFSYSFALPAQIDESEWHLASDDKKKVDGIDLKEKVGKGAVIVQTSKDGKNWITDNHQINFFANEEMNGTAFYTSKDIQLTNGTYFRIIIAYEQAKLAKTNKILFVEHKEYEYRKIAEEYTFYLQYRDTIPADNAQEYMLTDMTSKVNTGEKDNGYSGVSDITKDDPHFGWEMGEFYVTGFTQKTEDKNDVPVFLKNVGDQVTLYFSLKQDINKLNGKDSVYVTEDEDGSDQNFEVTRRNFGRGTLIIKYTNHENKKTDPIVYTNFLEANAVTTADTAVYVFEEGDYEVCLDYEIRYDKTKIWSTSLFPETNHYRIYFKFLVRNSNCMVFPFEVGTNNELNNSSYTKNGFYIDMANSHYLRTFVKREVLNEKEDGFAEDTRFNREVKDGDKFTEDGIYTITVNNEFTNQTVTKKIYVGDSSLVKAYMISGMDLKELKKLIESGATINEDGTITYPEMVEQNAEPESTDETKDEIAVETKHSSVLPIVLGSVSAAVVLLTAIIYVISRKKKKQALLEQKHRELISMKDMEDPDNEETD